MRYVVQARLKHGTPQLSVIDLDSGQVRLRWRLEKIHEMFDTGEINRDEFLQPEKYGMKLLLKNLFLIACTESMVASPTPPQKKSSSGQVTTEQWCFTPCMGHMK